jgi:hypothetical protein
MARFLLALLMALFSVPAMAAAEHCAPAPQTTAPHHGTQHRAPERHQPADAACIGCIAPSALPAPRPAPVLAYPAEAPVAAAITGAPIGPAQPATPPPRPA